jgi:arabinofuranosyltransferase
MIFSLFIFAYELFSTAWIGDDSLFTIRTILNWLNGYGPVFNVGERVQAYTHPLWFFLLSFLVFITGSVYFPVFFASISLSLFNIWFLIKRISTSLMGCLVAVAILLFSHAFVDYSTSGLENPLAHFFILFICYYAFEFIKNPSQKLLTSFSLMLGFLYLTRQDLVLCVAPLATYIFYKAKNEGLRFRLSISLGLIPILSWTTFSIFYYGSPFPNTAYAKLGTGIDVMSLIFQGRYYFLDSWRHDPITLLAILTGLFVSFRSVASVKAIGLGALLYLLYILYIGGDFMSGRFFTTPLLLMCIVISRTDFLSKSLWYWMLALTALAIYFRPIAVWSEGGNYPGIYSNIPYQQKYGINDERSLYYKWYSLSNWIIGDPSFAYPDKWMIGKEMDIEVMCNAYDGVRKGPTLQLIDPCGLSDPLLARLPALKKREWGIGHFFREIPEGYLNSIQSHENLIADQATKDFYSAIKLVTQGPLLSWDRLKMIALLNFNLIPKPNQYLYQYGSNLEVPLNDGAIHFSRAGLTSRGLGWQGHEDWGTWSNGNIARLAFKLSNPEMKTLQLRLRALVGGSIKCQQLTIEINHKKRLSECLSNAENNIIRIPISKSDRVSGDLLVIDFLLPNAVSPKSIGLSSDDERVLAIGLQEAIFQ